MGILNLVRENIPRYLWFLGRNKLGNHQVINFIVWAYQLLDTIEIISNHLRYRLTNSALEIPMFFNQIL